MAEASQFELAIDIAGAAGPSFVVLGFAIYLLSVAKGAQKAAEEARLLFRAARKKESHRGAGGRPRQGSATCEFISTRRVARGSYAHGGDYCHLQVCDGQMGDADRPNEGWSSYFASIGCATSSQ
jgi:hypothetical protein